jgi:hypothetical protein
MSGRTPVHISRTNTDAGTRFRTVFGAAQRPSTIVSLGALEIELEGGCGDGKRFVASEVRGHLITAVL